MTGEVIMTPISNLEITLGIIAVLTSATLGLTVYLKNPKSWTNRFFAFMALIYTLYPIANTISLHPLIPSASHNLFWIRMDLFLGSFMASSLLMFAHTFPGKKITMGRKYLIFIGIIVLGNAIMSWTPLFFPSVYYPEGATTAVTTMGPMIMFYLFSFFGMSIASFVILLKKYKNTRGVEKIKVLYLLIGISATLFLTGIMVIFFVAVLNYTGTVFLGPIFPIILMSFTAYSIIKHKFLDIEPIIARAVSYTLLVALFAIGYSAILFYGVSKIFHLNIDLKHLIVNSALALIVAISFRSLHLFISKITDKLFFRGRYNAQKILSDLTHAITSNIDFNKLSDKLLKTIIDEMRVSKAGLLLIENDKVSMIRDIGFLNEQDLKNADFNKFIKSKKNSNYRFFTMGELEDEESKNFFRKYNIEVIFPIKALEKYVAILVLGDKLSGLPYSSQDLNLLDVFASESGIAIDNAKLYSNLEKALKSKSELISVVSHQLRTPVSGIKWGLESLKQGGSSRSEKTKVLNTSYLKTIFLEQQLDDILIALDIYDQKVSIKKEECDLKEIFENIISDFAEPIVENKIKITYAISGDSVYVNADKLKLKKVLKTLIKNAVLYSEKGGEVIVSSQIEKDGNKEKILITVSDKGAGMTKEELDHIFEEFFRSERIKKKLPDGLGLGMFIAKAFIEAHGGRIWAYSGGENMGADVHIELPRH